MKSFLQFSLSQRSFSGRFLFLRLTLPPLSLMLACIYDVHASMHMVLAQSDIKAFSFAGRSIKPLALSLLGGFAGLLRRPTSPSPDIRIHA